MDSEYHFSEDTKKSFASSVNRAEVSFPPSNAEVYNVEKQQDFDVYGHEGIMAFGCCASGDHVCLDCRDNQGTDEPKVVVMFHDCADENYKMLIRLVADRF